MSRKEKEKYTVCECNGFGLIVHDGASLDRLHLAPGDLLTEFLDSLLDQIPPSRLILLGLVGNILHIRRKTKVPNVLAWLVIVAPGLVHTIGEDPVDLRGELFLVRDECARIHVEGMDILLLLITLLCLLGFQACLRQC